MRILDIHSLHNGLRFNSPPSPNSKNATNLLCSSCGTLTTSAKGEIPEPGEFTESTAITCDKSKLSDTANYCNTTPYTDSNGHADGKVVFVLTDCATDVALPNGQDDAYWFPGVATGPKPSKL